MGAVSRAGRRLGCRHLPSTRRSGGPHFFGFQEQVDGSDVDTFAQTGGSFPSTGSKSRSTARMSTPLGVKPAREVQLSKSRSTARMSTPGDGAPRGDATCGSKSRSTARMSTQPELAPRGVIHEFQEQVDGSDVDTNASDRPASPSDGFQEQVDGSDVDTRGCGAAPWSAALG